MNNISATTKTAFGHSDRRGPTPLDSLISAARRWLHNRAARSATVKETGSKAAREAEALRAYAHTFEKTDRGFASDLYAAANRHEILGDS